METIRSGWAPFKIQSCLWWVFLLSDRKKEQVHWLRCGGRECVLTHALRLGKRLLSRFYQEHSGPQFLVPAYDAVLLKKQSKTSESSRIVEKKHMKVTPWLPTHSTLNTSYQYSSSCLYGLVHCSNDSHCNCCVKGLSGGHS